jgi:hypothetical protein
MSEDLKRLVQRLETARPEIEKHNEYFTGNQPLKFLAPEVRESVGKRLDDLNFPWPRLVIGALEERLDVSGFRLAPDADPDTEIWSAIWQPNQMDLMSQQAHEEALVSGRAYAVVWARKDGSPLITVESPQQVIVEHHPATRERLRAIKVWLEDDVHHAFLYEPDRITRWRSKGKGLTSVGMGWDLVETLDNPLGIVCVVPLVNRQRILKQDGESELAPLLRLFDGVNKIGTDLMTSSEFHAMPRRFATGISIEEEIVKDDQGNPVLDEDTGQPVTRPKTQFSNVAGKVWISEDPESRFGSFPNDDLRGFIESVKLLTAAIASASGLPPHVLALQGSDNPASADAIRSSEASLIKNAERKQRQFGEAWEEVVRLALQVRDGSVPPEAQRLECVWKDAATPTVAQAADAALKKQAIGVPVQQLWEDLGYSPVQIERFKAMQRQAMVQCAALDLEKVAQQ